MMYVRIFTATEKRELGDRVIREAFLDKVDLSGAVLRGTHFERVSLRGCNLRGADLRGVAFVRCDVRDALLLEVELGDNSFEGSWFMGATGLSADQLAYIAQRGGRFVASGDCPTAGLTP